jgi:hypothetical protein
LLDWIDEVRGESCGCRIGKTEQVRGLLLSCGFLASDHVDRAAHTVFIRDVAMIRQKRVSHQLACGGYRRALLELHV